MQRYEKIFIHVLVDRFFPSRLEIYVLAKKMNFSFVIFLNYS